MNTNNNTIVESCWMLSGLFFILSLGGLSNQKTAKKGNLLGIFGMTLAIVVSFFTSYLNDMAVLKFFIALTAGAVVGIFLALRIEMIKIPQLIVVFYGFISIAVVIDGYANFLATYAAGKNLGYAHNIEIYISIFIGAFTFIGSFFAFLKLEDIIRNEPLIILGWGRHVINVIIMLAVLILGAYFVIFPNITYLYVMTALGLLIGWHLVKLILL